MKNRLIRNTAFELYNEVITIIASILVPRFVILCFGSEVNGLSSAITQLLNALNLLQAGAASAATYLMYKPVSTANIIEINSIYQTTKKHYLRLCILFSALSIVIAPVFAHALESEIDTRLIIISIYLVAFKMALDLCFTSPYRVVFTAHQENYVMSLGHIIETLVYNATIFLVIVTKSNFIFLYAGLVIGCFVKMLFLRVMSRKRYPEISFKIILKRKSDGLRNSMSSLLSEVSLSIVSMAPTITISLLSGLEYASIYSVYMLVQTAINTVVACVYKAYSSRLGTVIACGDEKNVKDEYRRLRFSILVVGSILFTCTAILLPSFISLYTKGLPNTYVNRVLVWTVVLTGIANTIRIPSSVFVTSAGLFKKTYKAAFISSIICVLIGIVVLKLCGYEYATISALLMYLYIAMYQEKVVGKNLTLTYNTPSGKAHSMMLAMSLTVIFVVVISLFVGQAVSATSWIMFCAYGLLTMLTVTVITICLFFVVDKKTRDDVVLFLKSRKYC